MRPAKPAQPRQATRSCPARPYTVYVTTIYAEPSGGHVHVGQLRREVCHQHVDSGTPWQRLEVRNGNIEGREPVVVTVTVSAFRTSISSESVVRPGESEAFMTA